MEKWILYYLDNGCQCMFTGYGSYDEVQAQLLKEKSVSWEAVLGGYPDELVAIFESPLAKSPGELFTLLQKANLFWRDPDPIPGNDYAITYLRLFEDGETALIQYGERSEAEIFITELSEGF